MPGILIVRPESGIFFASVEHVRRSILAEVEPQKPYAVEALGRESGGQP